MLIVIVKEAIMRPNGSAAVLEVRRFRAIELLKSGKTPTQVSQILGVLRQTVQRWKATVRDGGKRAIKAVPQYVPPCRLAIGQQCELGKIIAARAMASGFATDLWTTSRIAKVIWKKFKIRYNHDHVGRMLHRLGYTCQKPAGKAREHDDRAERQWRFREWPRIKKGRRIQS